MVEQPFKIVVVHFNHLGFLLQLRSGAVAARRAHNAKVAGSTPASAKFLLWL